MRAPARDVEGESGSGGVSTRAPISARWLIAAAAFLVPGHRRQEWRRQWKAEIEHRCIGGAESWKVTGFALGAVSHALYLRREEMTMRGWFGDIRHSVRSLASRPGFSLLAISTLAMSTAMIGGELVDDTAKQRRFFREAVGSGELIFQARGYTNYAVASAAVFIAECVERDARRTMPVSGLVGSFRGVGGLCLSLPCVIGAEGIHKQLRPALSDEEVGQLHASAEAIQAQVTLCRQGAGL